MKKLLPGLLLILSAQASAGIVAVQHKSSRCATATTCSVCLGSSCSNGTSDVTAGDTILIFPGGGAFNPTGLTDSNGTVTQARAIVATSVSAGISYVPNTTSFTDDGSSSPEGYTWTTTTGPPSTGNDLSSYRFLINSNLMQTPTQSAVPSGNTIVPIGGTGPSGTGGNNNIFATSGLLNTSTGLQIGSTYLCIDGAETGC